jgi:hypothetical protein
VVGERSILGAKSNSKLSDLLLGLGTCNTQASGDRGWVDIVFDKLFGQFENLTSKQYSARSTITNLVMHHTYAGAQSISSTIG